MRFFIIVLYRHVHPVYYGKVSCVNIADGWICLQDLCGSLGGASLNIVRMPLEGGSAEVVSTNCAADINVSYGAVVILLTVMTIHFGAT